MTSSIPLSYATCSLGTPTTPLQSKLQALHSASFTGIELSFPDLLSFASAHHNHPIAEDDYPSLRTAASALAALAAQNNLTIMMLQPFSNLEGWPRGSPQREDAFKRARGWISIMEAAGIPMLQVGSSDTPLEKLSSPAERLRSDIVDDLRELADLLHERGMRLAYENWCWSSHAPTWRDVWEIVSAVGRDNVGLCLDTFQSAGGEWGDPSTVSGLVDNIAPGSKENKALDEAFRRSMDELRCTVPREKIYLLQVSDAYRPVTGPLSKEVDVDGTATRGRWSHDFRPMPYDGGYLPIEEVGRAVLGTGFRGWFSMEIFDGGADGRGREGVDLGEFAGRAGEKMREFIGNCLKERSKDGGGYV
ncbi:xylose isomerase-like protein [Aspergillus egyptiacus]|nr:xylose isomerase-like protein [Aspergillus egyptiacus]